MAEMVGISKIRDKDFKITCCRVMGGLSVRVNDKEAYLLPNRLELTVEELERAFDAVVMSCNWQSIEDAIDAATEEAYQTTRQELSKW